MKTDQEIEAEERAKAESELQFGHVPEESGSVSPLVSELRAKRTRDAAERLRKGFWQKQKGVSQ